MSDGGHFDYRGGGGKRSGSHFGRSHKSERSCWCAARDAAKFVAEQFYWLCGMPMPKLVGGQAWPVCGPVGWNPVDKTGPWFSPNPDGSASGAAGTAGPDHESLRSMLTRIQSELGIDGDASAKESLRQAWAAIGEEPAGAAGLRQEAEAVLTALGLPLTAAPSAVAVQAEHPADNVHWEGRNPGNTIGLGEVLAELAELKEQVAARL